MSTKGAYPFAEKQEKYASYTLAQLRYAAKDAAQAARAMKGHDPMAENWYMDDYYTLSDEIRRRGGVKVNPVRAARIVGYKPYTMTVEVTTNRGTFNMSFTPVFTVDVPGIQMAFAKDPKAALKRLIAGAESVKTKGNPTTHLKGGLAAAKARLAPLGVTINWKASTDEYRVNFIGGKEATAYYTNDLRDAVGTGEAMAAHKTKYGQNPTMREAALRKGYGAWEFENVRYGRRLRGALKKRGVPTIAYWSVSDHGLRTFGIAYAPKYEDAVSRLIMTTGSGAEIETRGELAKARAKLRRWRIHGKRTTFRPGEYEYETKARERQRHLARRNPWYVVDDMGRAASTSKSTREYADQELAGMSVFEHPQRGNIKLGGQVRTPTGLPAYKNPPLAAAWDHFTRGQRRAALKIIGVDPEDTHIWESDSWTALEPPMKMKLQKAWQENRR